MTQKPKESGAPLRAVLFPHVGLEERDLKRALALFDHLTVCIPWDLQAGAAPAHLASFIDFLSPPEALRPPPEFKKVLAEHRLWIREHRDRGLTAFLAALPNSLRDQENTWEIRRAIRAGGPVPPAPPDEKALECHLILHLFYEFEQTRSEVDEAVAALRRAGSPLKEAMDEEAEAPGPLEDLPGPDPRPSMEESQVFGIASAWMGLFGDRLAQAPFVLTFCRELPPLIRQGLEESGGPLPKAGQRPEARFHVSDPASLGEKAFAALKKRPGCPGREALTALAAKVRDPSFGLDGILEACRRVESVFQTIEASGPQLAVSLLPLTADAGSGGQGRAAELARRMGTRVLALVEETGNDG